jgi:hypothetical protein
MVMKAKTRLALVLLGSALAGAATALAQTTASASGAEDDLAVIKRAVRSPASLDRVAAPAVEAAPAPPKRRVERPRRGDAPRWLKVRVVEKGTTRNKVTVNLPLALVHVLGHDDWPIAFHCRGEGSRRCSMRFGEVLEALEAGQDLVTIDAEDETVRVWLE